MRVRRPKEKRKKYRPIVEHYVLYVNAWFIVDCDFTITVQYGDLCLVTTRDERLTSDRFRRRHFFIVDSLNRDWFMEKPLLGYHDTYRIGNHLYHVFEDDWNVYNPEAPVSTGE